MALGVSLTDIANAATTIFGGGGENTDAVINATSAIAKGDLIGGTIKRVRLLSEYTAPIELSAAQIKAAAAAKPDPNAPMKLWGRLVKPTLIIESPLIAQPYIIAPYGQASVDGWKTKQSTLKWGVVGMVTLLLGTAFMLGRWSKRRAAG
jgi:hypothetical protein